MVIDSDERMRKLISALLTEQGHQVLQSASGVDATRKLSGVTPSLFLVDHDVPLGGLRTVRILRMNPKYRAVPFLLSVGLRKDDAMAFIQEAQDVGVSRFVGKPYELSVLLDKVNEVLAERDRTMMSAVAVKQEVRALSDLPMMSPTHRKVLDLLSCEDDEVDIQALTRTIESDQGLAARVLKIARSAYYAFQGRLIRTAIMFLGIQNIRHIVQAATVFDVFEKQGEGTGAFERIELWKHAVACGIVMQMLSRQIRGSGHFLTGLLHDMGKIVLDYRFTEYFRQIIELVEEEGMTMYQAEQKILGISHAEIGQEICQMWRLPGEIGICVANHHDPAQAPMHRRLASLVHLSDIAVRTMGIGHGGDSRVPEVNAYAARFRIKLDPVYARKEEIIQQVESIVSSP